MNESRRRGPSSPDVPSPPTRRDPWPCRPPRGHVPGAGDPRRVMAALLLAALVGGCAQKEEVAYPHTNLGGFVTVDNQPVEGGMISFCSQDTRNGQVVVTKVVRGRYIAEKVPLGKVLAVISGTRETGEKLRPGAPSEIANLVPEKYRAGFELDVTEHSAQVDFKMLSN
jgi:hypothetical protein